VSTNAEERPERAIANAMDRLSKLATIRPLDAHDVDAELAIVERSLAEIRKRHKRAARALRAALMTWCDGRRPGGDGADGETFDLCQAAANLLDPEG